MKLITGFNHTADGEKQRLVATSLFTSVTSLPCRQAGAVKNP